MALNQSSDSTDIVDKTKCTRCSVPKRNVGHLNEIYKKDQFVLGLMLHILAFDNRCFFLCLQGMKTSYLELREASVGVKHNEIFLQ